MKYYLIREPETQDITSFLQGLMCVELTGEELLEISFGIKDYKVLEKVVDILKGDPCANK